MNPTEMNLGFFVADLIGAGYCCLFAALAFYAYKLLTCQRKEGESE